MSSLSNTTLLRRQTNFLLACHPAPVPAGVAGSPPAEQLVPERCGAPRARRCDCTRPGGTLEVGLLEGDAGGAAAEGAQPAERVPAAGRVPPAAQEAEPLRRPAVEQLEPLPRLPRHAGGRDVREVRQAAVDVHTCGRERYISVWR